MNDYDNKVDEMFGFERLPNGTERLGWLLNYIPTTIVDSDGNEVSGIELYFIDRNGDNFKGSILFEPYLLVDISDKNRLHELSQHLQKRISTCFVTVVEKEDLDMPNHLNGNKHSFLKLSFKKVSDLMDAKTNTQVRCRQVKCSSSLTNACFQANPVSKSKACRIY